MLCAWQAFKLYGCTLPEQSVCIQLHCAGTHLYKFADSFSRCRASSSPSASRRQRVKWRLAFPVEPLGPACQIAHAVSRTDYLHLLPRHEFSKIEKQHLERGISDDVTLLLLHAMRNSLLGAGQLALGRGSPQSLQCFSAR